MSKESEVAARAKAVAEYTIETNSTVRSAAEHFGVSKSTIFVDLRVRVGKYNPELVNDVQDVLANNKADRARRGGYATHTKYCRTDIQGEV